MKKKLVVTIMSICLAFGLAACSSFNEGVQDAMEETEQTEETATAEEETEEPETTTEEVAAEEPEEETTQEETVEEPTEEETEEAPQEATGNPLLDAEVQVNDVMNGAGTEKIGEWAEVNISKEVLKTVTNEQFTEFCTNVVDNSGYNWFTIICDDGTGIVFSGSMTSNATYGEVDNEGAITTAIGYILLEDGAYTYSE